MTKSKGFRPGSKMPGKVVCEWFEDTILPKMGDMKAQVTSVGARNFYMSATLGGRMYDVNVDNDIMLCKLEQVPLLLAGIHPECNVVTRRAITLMGDWRLDNQT